jgi:hypothetical protein
VIGAFMVRNNKSTLVLVLLATWLGACNTVSQKHLLSTVTLPSQTKMLIPTRTRWPTNLPVDVTFLIDFPDPTLTPSLTPTSLKPDSGQTIDLPQWLKDPSQEVLMYSKQNENLDQFWSGISFLNPHTGEAFDIDVPEFAFFYWQDNNQVVLVHGDCGAPSLIAILDVSTSTIRRYNPADIPFKTKRCYNSSAPEEFSMISDHSPGGSDSTLTVIDNLTGEEMVFTNPSDGLNDGDGIISSDKKYIAIPQSKNLDDLFYGPYNAEKLSIYDFEEVKLIMNIKEEGISFAQFFPDSNKLLYMRENTPCLVNIATQQKKCYPTIANRFPDSNIYPGQPSMDGKDIGFIFENFEAGGLCLYGLSNGTLHCPTDRLNLGEYQRVVGYASSPDDKYAVFVYDDGCPICDFQTNPSVAVIGWNGEDFIDLGHRLDMYAPYHTKLFPWYQWRPLP